MARTPSGIPRKRDKKVHLWVNGRILYEFDKWAYDKCLSRDGAFEKAIVAAMKADGIEVDPQQ